IELDLEPGDPFAGVPNDGARRHPDGDLGHDETMAQVHLGIENLGHSDHLLDRCHRTCDLARRPVVVSLLPPPWSWLGTGRLLQSLAELSGEACGPPIESESGRLTPWRRQPPAPL